MDRQSNLVRSNLVAAILPTLSNPQFGLITRGLSEALDGCGYELFLGVTEYVAAKEQRLIGEIMRRDVAALAVTGVDHSAETVRMLGQAGVPVVEFFDSPAVPIAHLVAFDHAAVGRAVVRHLAAHNRRRIAVVAPMDGFDRRAERRAMGVVTGAHEVGLPPVTLLRCGCSLASMEQGAAGVADVVENHSEVDAIVCMNDYAALGAIDECRRRKVAVPERIAVTGFGDLELSKHVYPSITTVSFNALSLGREIGAVVVRSIDDARAGRPHAPHRSDFGFEIVSRESA